MSDLELKGIATQLNRLASAMEHIAEQMKRFNDLAELSMESEK